MSGRRRHGVTARSRGAAEQPSVALGAVALGAAHRHAASSDAEVGGLLLGAVVTGRRGTHVAVVAALAAERTRSGPTHVTFTADSWAGMIRRKQREHPGAAVVGWYHSHPRLGIFLSDLDLAIHRGFFREPWHVALVVNGHDRTAGCFVWEGAEVRPARHLLWPARPEWPGRAVHRARGGHDGAGRR